MTALAPAAHPGAVRRAPYTAAVLVVAGAAWLYVVLRLRGMSGMPGAMGLGLPAFVVVWAVMMSAMMLPSAAPLAAMYARTLRAHRQARMAVFVTGYVAVWAAAGVPAYGLALVAGEVAGKTPAAGTISASVLFGVNGVYQLSPWKGRCLARCRLPLALLLRYASWHGPLRDLRAAAHHGLSCLGCCWTLMALMAAFGLMNLWAMVGLATAVGLEKLLPSGQRVARMFGVASLVLAVAVFWAPWLVPGLHAPTGGMG